MAEKEKIFFKAISQFRTLNTTNSAVTMKDDECDLLTNFMPIGLSLYTVPGYSAILATIGNSEAVWQATHTYAANAVVRPTVANGFIYMVTAGGGGNSGGSEPTWPLVNGNTVVDGALTWTTYSSTVMRGFTVNLNGTLYNLIATVGGALYFLDGSYNQFRLCLPATLTNPKFEQWNYLYSVLVDPTAGYFSVFGLNAPFGAAGTAMATTAAKVKFTNNITYYISTNSYTKSATDNFWDLTGFNVTNSYYNKCYLYISTAGVASIAAGTQNTSWVGVVMPALDTTKALVGTLSVHPTGTGNFTGGTTALNDGTVVPNATYLDQTLLQLIDNTLKGSSIAVWQNRVWIGTGTNRGILFSSPGLYNDFTTLNGGGVVTDNYTDLRNQIMNLVSSQDYLYVCGDHSTHVIYGLQISASGNTSFNLSDALPTVGALYPETAIASGPIVLMMGDVGINAVNAGSREYISQNLEGAYISFDTTFLPIAFFAKIYNKLCYCVLVRMYDPVNGTPGKWLLCFYEGRWFMVYFGLDLVYGWQKATTTDTLAFAAYGNNIIQLFTGVSSLTHQVRTRAFTFGTPLYDKHVMKVGASILNTIGLTGNIVATISAIGTGSPQGNTSGSATSGPIGTTGVTFTPNLMTWLNNSGGTISWLNGATPLLWYAAYNDMDSYGNCNGRGKRIQIDYTETSATQYILNELFVEGEYAASY